MNRIQRRRAKGRGASTNLRDLTEDQMLALVEDLTPEAQAAVLSGDRSQLTPAVRLEVIKAARRLVSG